MVLNFTWKLVSATKMHKYVAYSFSKHRRQQNLNDSRLLANYEQLMQEPGHHDYNLYDNPYRDVNISMTALVLMLLSTIPVAIPIYACTFCACLSMFLCVCVGVHHSSGWGAGGGDWRVQHLQGGSFLIFNIKKLKNGIPYFYYCGSFCPPGSGSCHYF